MLKKAVILLLSLLAFLPGRAQYLEVPKDKLDKPILFGSRIVTVSSSRGKVFAPGQRNPKPVLVHFHRQDSAIVLSRHHKNRKHGYQAPLALDIVEETPQGLVVSLDKVFSTYPEIISAIPPKMLPGRAVEWEIKEITQKEEYLQVTAAYRYQDGLDVVANCYFIYLREEPLASLEVDASKAGYTRLEGHRKHNKPSLRWDLSGGRKLVFYIDRCFPEDWVPYIKEGLEDWNKAFEAIGLGPVICALEEPDGLDRNGPLTNMVRYMDVEEANAKGDVLADPRSGEILQGDILWWKNVVELLKGWRYVQTGVADPSARQLDYPIEMLGPMIRHAVCHEMGHVLGLSHNMGASWSYTPRQLRSPSFTQEYGTCASVMDYARYNHLATAADLRKGVNLLPPRIGPYDCYAIALGYASEEPAPGPYCYFAPFISAAISPDPSSQAETLGNDLLLSSKTGVRNCRTLLGLDNLTQERVKLLRKQYYRYIFLSLSNIGGVVQGQPVSRKVRNNTLRFVFDALSSVPPQIADTEQQQNILQELEGNFLPERLEKTVSEKELANYRQQLKRLYRQYPKLNNNNYD